MRVKSRLGAKPSLEDVYFQIVGGAESAPSWLFLAEIGEQFELKESLR